MVNKKQKSPTVKEGLENLKEMMLIAEDKFDEMISKQSIWFFILLLIVLGLSSATFDDGQGGDWQCLELEEVEVYTGSAYFENIDEYSRTYLDINGIKRRVLKDGNDYHYFMVKEVCKDNRYVLTKIMEKKQ